MRGDIEGHARTRVGIVISKKYRLERVIGSGGMASVYEAVHQRNGNRVAIKMLHHHLSIDADIRARFLREGYVANLVEHPGAVRVLDDDMAEDGSVFLVMELLAGETLDARCKEAGGRLPAREVCRVAHQLLDVLAAAHAKGIVHRDIKPENVFVTSDGALKVLDFGIARLREASGPEGATKTGRMIGTPAFMPPEQVLGRSREIDGQTDVYAVGATMFALVSGHFVHEAETVEEMLVRAGSRPARSVVTVAPELAPAVSEVIDRALAFDKGRRWPDARAMADALATACRSAYGSVGPAARVSRMPGDSIAFVETAEAPAMAPTVDDPSYAGSGGRRIAPRALEETLGTGTQRATEWGGSAGTGTRRATEWGAPHPPVRGVSTTAGIAGAAPGGERLAGMPGASRRGARWAVLGGGAAVFVAGLGVLAAARGVSQKTTVEAPLPPSTASERAAAASQEARAPAAPEAAAPSTTAMSSAPPSVPASVPHVLPPPVPVGRSRSVPPATPASQRDVAPPQKQPDCDPPYIVLPNRRHEPKPECL